MSSSWDSSGASCFISNSNLTLTEIMDLGFVATVPGSSSPFQSQLEQLDSKVCSGSSSPFHPPLEQLDSRVRPKAVVAPFLVKATESTQAVGGGEKLCLGVEDVGSSVCPSPLNPDALLFEQSSMVSEQLTQFNSSIVGFYYGAKVSTPYKVEDGMETSDPLVVDIPTPKLQGSEVSTATLQKPVPPVWEISEINSALEENTPSLEVSITDLRFPNASSEPEPVVPVQPLAAPIAQWVGVKHKDLGRSYLQPFHYRRQLSASEIPVTSIPPAACSISLSAAVSPDKPEWQLEGMVGPQYPHHP